MKYGFLSSDQVKHRIPIRASFDIGQITRGAREGQSKVVMAGGSTASRRENFESNYKKGEFRKEAVENAGATSILKVINYLSANALANPSLTEPKFATTLLSSKGIPHCVQDWFGAEGDSNVKEIGCPNEDSNQVHLENLSCTNEAVFGANVENLFGGPEAIFCIRQRLGRSSLTGPIESDQGKNRGWSGQVN